MIKRILARTAAAALLAAPLTMALATPLAAQQSEGVGVEEMVFDHDGNQAASAHFLNGLALLHSFEYDRAKTAFIEAQAADPDFVMAYWGEAMTLNHPLWDEQDRDAALEALAKLGATPAARAAKARSPREQAWLSAVETLYGDGSKIERDLAYLAKMRRLLAADPTDIDARAFTGLAILGSSHGGRQIPLYMEAAGVLEEGFVTHPRHPGILHYLIHSYDDPVHAPLGLRMARTYAVVAPDAGHAQHMVSHIFNGLGMWPQSERANILADAVVDRQREASGRGETSCGHYNEWLVYALLQQGKDARPIIDGCRAQAEAELATFQESGEAGFPNAAFSYGDMEVRYGIATGDWRAPPDFSLPFYSKPRFDFAYGRMLASMGDAEEATAALATLETQVAETVALIRQMSAGADEVAPWVEAALTQGRAIEKLSRGQTEEGLAMLEAAGDNEAALPAVFGPPVIRKPSYELLGEVLLDLGRRDAAAEAFRKALAFAPGRRLSQEGLAAVQ